MNETRNDSSTGRALIDHQVAEQLGCSVHTLRKWRKLRIGPSYMKIGRLVRYRPEDVAQFKATVLVIPVGSTLKRGMGSPLYDPERKREAQRAGNRGLRSGGKANRFTTDTAAQAGSKGRESRRQRQVIDA